MPPAQSGNGNPFATQQNSQMIALAIAVGVVLYLGIYNIFMVLLFQLFY
jgi:hypothetical protein